MRDAEASGQEERLDGGSRNYQDMEMEAASSADHIASLEKTSLGGAASSSAAAASAGERAVLPRPQQSSSFSAEDEVYLVDFFDAQPTKRVVDEHAAFDRNRYRLLNVGHPSVVDGSFYGQVGLCEFFGPQGKGESPQGWDSWLVLVEGGGGGGVDRGSGGRGGVEEEELGVEGAMVVEGRRWGGWG